MVPPGSRVADIGTDQALLPRWLLSSDRASFCVASERDARRLDRARGFPAGHPLAGRLDLRSGDGLEVLEPSDRVDVVVVAGLGAEATCRILGRARLAHLGVRRLVLQPQTDPARVRRWLLDHGFRIVDERLVEEGGRFFPVIAAEPGPETEAEAAGPLSREDLLELGPCLLRSGDPAVARYWQGELQRMERILCSATSGRGRSEALSRRDLARRILATLDRITSELCGRTLPSGCPR